MDLHLLDAEADRRRARGRRRAARPAGVGWDGGARGRARRAHARVGGHAARAQRHLLLPALQALQERVGWISEGGARLRLRAAQRAARRRLGRRDVLRAALDRAAAAAGRPRLRRHRLPLPTARTELIAAARGARRRREGASATGRPATWCRSPCLGQCDRAPAALRDASRASSRGEQRARAASTRRPRWRRCCRGDAAASPPRHPPLPQHGDPSLRLLRRVGRVRPDQPRRLPRARRLRRAAARARARARGRDRARSRTRSCSAAAAPRSRPASSGTPSRASRRARTTSSATRTSPSRARSRTASLMEGDPFALDRGDDHRRLRDGLRARLRLPARRVPADAHRVAAATAIEEARRRGFLGDDVLGEGFAFDIEIRKGAGAYICGEETAIFNSIEGYRGEPRNKPPFPVVAGLFGKPTVVNNVETLVNVLPIVLDGGAGVRRDRHRGSRPAPSCSACPGTSSGPACTRCRSARRCASCSSWRAASRAGVRCRRCCWAAPPAASCGPTSSTCRSRFEGARAAETTLGSGVVLVMDDTVDLPRMLHAHRRVLPQRVVRPVRALPRRHGAPAGGAARGCWRAARAAASTRSWR